MKPIDFVLHAGVQYNDPVGDIMEALQKPIRVYNAKGELSVLSYYYDRVHKQMILDVEVKK